MITLRIDFGMYPQYISSINILILNDAIAENYIDLSNEESLFEYNEVIKYGRS